MKKEDYNIISIREKKETRNGETIEKEIAVLANGEEKLIHLDENGNKYINIHNPFAENKSIAAKYYVRRIKDAVESVKQGFGDSAFIYKLCGTHINVRRYIDRTIGETHRKKFMKGWKDANFTYGISITSSSFDGIPIGKNLNPCIYNYDTCEYERPMMFSTEEEAENWLNNLKESCKRYVLKIKNKGYIRADKEIADLIKKEYPEAADHCIIHDIIYSTLDGNENPFRFYIEQTIE